MELPQDSAGSTPKNAVLPVSLPTFIVGSVVLLVVVSIVSAFLGATIAMHSMPPAPKASAVDLIPLQEQQAYGRVVAIDYPLVVLNSNLAGNDCASVLSTANCEGDLSLLSRDAGKFMTDLKALKVPACFASTNAIFLQALPQLQNGATALEQAVRNNDAAAAKATVSQITQGSNGLERAMAAYKTATC